jgi:hypothetical protein
VVERVLAAHGITRGTEKAAAAAVPAPLFTVPAAKAAAASVSAAAPASASAAGEPCGAASASKTAAPAIEVAEFVSESEVREAMGRGAKIFIGPKTIVTPSARDLASEHDIFVETDRQPTPKTPRR